MSALANLQNKKPCWPACVSLSAHFTRSALLLLHLQPRGTKSLLLWQTLVQTERTSNARRLQKLSSNARRNHRQEAVYQAERCFGAHLRNAGTGLRKIAGPGWSLQRRPSQVLTRGLQRATSSIEMFLDLRRPLHDWTSWLTIYCRFLPRAKYPE
jgi:hypothetical protein